MPEWIKRSACDRPGKLLQLLQIVTMCFEPGPFQGFSQWMGFSAFVWKNSPTPLIKFSVFKKIFHWTRRFKLGTRIFWGQSRKLRSFSCLVNRTLEMRVSLGYSSSDWNFERHHTGRKLQRTHPQTPASLFDQNKPLLVSVSVSSLEIETCRPEDRLETVCNWPFLTRRDASWVCQV